MNSIFMLLIHCAIYSSTLQHYSIHMPFTSAKVHTAPSPQLVNPSQHTTNPSPLQPSLTKPTSKPKTITVFPPPHSPAQHLTNPILDQVPTRIHITFEHTFVQDPLVDPLWAVSQISSAPLEEGLGDLLLLAGNLT